MMLSIHRFKSPYTRPLKTQGSQGRLAHAVVKQVTDPREAEREYNMLRVANHERVLHAELAPCVLTFPLADCDLLTLLKTRRVEPEATWRILADLRDALFVIHSRGIVHRDVKLENVLIFGERAKLGDFGFATFIEPGEILSEICGTPGYVAPEILNREPYDQKVDVFSFGVCCFAACTRNMPFGKHGPREKIPSPGKEVWDALDVSDARRAAVESSLRLRPSERPSSLDLARLTLI